MLKYDNLDKHDSSVLRREASHWNLLYPDFKSSVRIEHWSGSIALLLPHVSFINIDSRVKYKTLIWNELNRIQSLGKYHTDVKWNHIGLSGGSIILLELDCIEKCSSKSSNWIEKAMKYLYPDGECAERKFLVLT